MIRAVFTVENGVVTGFEICGHSGYSEEGSDIICAAVSSAVYMTANTVTDVMELDCSLTVDDGLMKLSLSHDEALQAQVILNGLLLHLGTLSKENSDFISLKISEV